MFTRYYLERENPGVGWQGIGTVLVSLVLTDAIQFVACRDVRDSQGRFRIKDHQLNTMAFQHAEELPCDGAESLSMEEPREYLAKRL